MLRSYGGVIILRQFPILCQISGHEIVKFVNPLIQNCLSYIYNSV